MRIKKEWGHIPDDGKMVSRENLIIEKSLIEQGITDSGKKSVIRESRNTQKLPGKPVKLALKENGYQGYINQICDAIDLHHPESEYKFSKLRKWRFDFCWPNLMMAVEIHGGVWSQGRHTRGSGFIKDREKMNEAQLLGWCVFEVTPQQITDGILQHILHRYIKGDHVTSF